MEILSKVFLTELASENIPLVNLTRKIIVKTLTRRELRLYNFIINYY